MRTLLLCALLAGVGGAEEYKVYTSCFTPTEQVPSMDDFKKLEKRVAEIEKREKAASFRLSDEQIRAHNEKMFIMGCTSTDQPGCK